MLGFVYYSQVASTFFESAGDVVTDNDRLKGVEKLWFGGMLIGGFSLAQSK